MKLEARRSQRFGLALSDALLLPGLLGMRSQLLNLSFRGARIRVLAAHNPEGQQARPPIAGEPVTDPFHLELLSGAGPALAWPRPVTLDAVIETRSDPVLAVQRASRWASYAARVAVVPEDRLDDRALLEARLRNVWLVAASRPGRLRVAAAGERGPAEGSVRGLTHRLLDELIWAALPPRREGSGTTHESAATR